MAFNLDLSDVDGEIPDAIEAFEQKNEMENYADELEGLLKYLAENHHSNEMRINEKIYEIQIDGDDGDGIINFKTGEVD